MLIRWQIVMQGTACVASNAAILELTHCSKGLCLCLVAQVRSPTSRGLQHRRYVRVVKCR